MTESAAHERVIEEASAYRYRAFRPHDSDRYVRAPHQVLGGKPRKDPRLRPGECVTGGTDLDCWRRHGSDETIVMNCFAA
jgi:hypothetical protein